MSLGARRDWVIFIASSNSVSVSLQRGQVMPFFD